MNERPNLINPKSGSQKQTSEKKESIFSIPYKPKLDLSKLCLFDQSRIASSEMKEFIEYVKKIYPNKSNNLGVLMQRNIDEQKALEILKQTDYDVTKAKFIVTFPVLSKSIFANKDRIGNKPEELNKIFEKFQKKNSMLHQKQEIIHFRDVLDGIDNGDLNISFQDLSFLIKDAKSNKFKVPLKVKRVFEESIHSSRQIEKLIEGNKKLEDLEILMENIKTVVVKPQNYDRLSEFVANAKKIEAEITEIINSKTRVFKDMQNKINPLKALNLKSSNDQPIHIFKKLFEKCQSHFNEIQQIINPYNTKSNHKKFDFNKIQQVLDYFIKENVEDPKINLLSQMIHETLSLLSNCQMFLEDSRPSQIYNIEDIISRLENSRFDFKGYLTKVKGKFKDLATLKSLKETWNDVDKTKANLKKIKRLLNSEEEHFYDDVVVYKQKLELIEHFK